MLYLVLSRYWYLTFIQTYSATSPLNPHWEMDKTFSPSYSSSQITYVEAVGFSRFRFRFHRKRTASTASSFHFRFHIPDFTMFLLQDTTSATHTSYLQYHRCRSRQIFGCERILPEFLQTCPKTFRATLCVSISSHTDHCRDDLQKNRSSCYSPHVECQFIKIKQRWAPFLAAFSGSLPRISGILRKFS